MKTKTKFLKGAVIASLIFASSHASAVVVTVSTGFSLAFEDSAGNAIPNGTGFIASGFFQSIADGSLSGSSTSSLESDFLQFTVASAQFGNTGFDGFVNYTSNAQRVASTDAFFGENLYVFFGNGSSISNSTEFAIFRSDLTFPDDSGDAVDADLTIDYDAPTPPPGSFLVGVTGGSVTISGTPVNSVEMQQAVPEPSIAILSLLGMLGLLRRRRTQ